ncbi:MAG: PH domain-containing protein [Thermodesulfobacteriota bacterium]
MDNISGEGRPAPDTDGLAPGEKVLATFRPAWRSFWVFFFGLLLCGLGPFLRENSPLRPTTGLILAAVFLIIILRRWSNVYTLTDRRLLVRGGLIARDTTGIYLADLAGVDTHQGFSTRLVGTGHLYVRSRIPDQESILIYGQPDHPALKERLERLAAEAGGPGRPPAKDDL